jgi:spore coat protein H
VQERLPCFDLWIAPADLAALDSDPGSDRMVPAEVALDGVRAPAAVRYRGASSRYLPQKSFKVELDPGWSLEGRDHFALLAEWVDAGKLTEKFAVDLLEALGLRAPRARYVKVYLNGAFYGVHLDMEHVGKEFLRAHGLEPDASIYRCGGRDCELKAGPPGSTQQPFEKKTNEEAPWDDLHELLRLVGRSDDAAFDGGVERALDLDAYLGNLAVDALVSNNVIEDSRSYWIHEHGRDRWVYVPWDLNNALSTFRRDGSARPSDRAVRRDARVFTAYDPWVDTIWRQRVAENPAQRPTWSVLATRLWDRPSTRARIVEWMEAALAGPFSEAEAAAHVEALWAVAGPEILQDPFVDAEKAPQAPAVLLRFVRERRAFLEDALASLRRHGEGPLVVNEIAFSDAGAGWLELHNRGDVPVSLEGLAVTDDLRDPRRFPLPPATLAPGAFLDVPFPADPEGGEAGLFRVGTSFGPLDAVWFGVRAPGGGYGRVPDGAESFSSTSPTRAAANVAR